MEGIIRIEGYKIHCVVGVDSHERSENQELSMDIEMRLNMLECAQTDSVNDTVDYREIARVCHNLATSRQYNLLETFAYEAVHALMEAFSPSWVKVRLKKKRALPLADYAVVEMELSKK